MTKHLTAIIASATIITALTGRVDAQEITVESMPPSVVKTVPASGDSKVPATTKEIKVTFR